MKELIETNGGILGFIVMVAMALNLLLSGVSKFLDFIKDKTKNETDNKIAAIVHKIAAVLQKIIDWSSANRAH
jgi:hypothetical protein